MSLLFRGLITDRPRHPTLSSDSRFVMDHLRSICCSRASQETTSTIRKAFGQRRRGTDRTGRKVGASQRSAADGGRDEGGQYGAELVSIAIGFGLLVLFLDSSSFSMILVSWFPPGRRFGHKPAEMYAQVTSKLTFRLSPACLIPSHTLLIANSEALALGTKTGMSTRMIWSAIRSALGNSW